MLDKRVAGDRLRTIRITFEGKEVLLSAFCDTGNKLTDPFDGTPVIICEYRVVKEILPQALQRYFADCTGIPPETGWNRKIRLVPCQTVNGSGMIPCFFPDRFQEISGDTVREHKVLIGICQEKLSAGEYTALFNAVLFQNS